MEKQLILVCLIYVCYLFALAVKNFRTRLRAVVTNQVDMKHYKAYQGPSPEDVIVMGRHYDNHFQLPMLFLITCLFHLTLKRVDEVTVILAVLFLLTRFVHTWIHLGENIVRQRAMWFGFGWFCVLALWAQICWFVLN